MGAAWDVARAQAKGAALPAGAEASWLGEDAATAADLRALAEALRLREVAPDHLLVIRARLDGVETLGYTVGASGRGEHELPHDARRAAAR